MNLMLGFMRHTNLWQSQQIVDFAIENGINNFEVCPFYLNGNCEDYVYSLLYKYSRNSYYIEGKMPIRNFINYNNYQDIFFQSLEKVPGNYFDIYLLQAVNKHCIYQLYSQNIIQFFLKQKELGTIKKFGLSIQCDNQTFENLLKLNCWDIIQMPLNIYDYYLCGYDKNYELACEYNVPIIAQAPFKGGMLKDYDFEALKFVQSLSNIEQILIGSSHVDTIKKICYNYNKENIKKIEYLNILNNYIQPISCLSCQLCTMACHKNIPISWIFDSYNKSLKNKIIFNTFASFKQNYGEPSQYCDNCGKCEEVCPLNLQIINLLNTSIFELRF